MKKLSFLLVGLCFILMVTPAFAQDVAWIDGGTLAGQTLSSTDWIIDVEINQSITGNVLSTAYNSHFTTTSAIVPYGYTWTWGDRTTDYTTVDSWINLGNNNFDTAINLTAPSTPGTYFIIFACGGEMNMGNIFSNTNWAVGGNVWNDGNDYYDMGYNELAFAHANGYVHNWLALNNSGYHLRDLAAAPIMVNVSAAPVPEPTTLLLLCTGLIGLAGTRRKFKK